MQWTKTCANGDGGRPGANDRPRREGPAHPPGHPIRHALAGTDRLEHDLARAAGLGQLSLRYQPIVELASGTAVGFEALLRWDHAERGPLPPLQFIPLAEHSGLIIPIGAWVLARACQQAAGWNHRTPVPVKISVNVSAVQLSDPDLPGMVLQVLTESGLAADKLILEITESVALHHDRDTLALLRQIKDIGVQLAIDDFGTGYSALAHLRRLPVDIVKIDKLFVDDLATDPDANTVLAAIVKLASGLRLTTLAEGIEAADQYRPLYDLGCQFGQGFYFAKPLTASEAEDIAIGGV